MPENGDKKIRPDKGKGKGKRGQSDGNEVAVDTIEIAHEGLTIANPADS